MTKAGQTMRDHDSNHESRMQCQGGQERDLLKEQVVSGGNSLRGPEGSGEAQGQETDKGAAVEKGVVPEEDFESGREDARPPSSGDTLTVTLSQTPSSDSRPFCSSPLLPPPNFTHLDLETSVYPVPGVQQTWSDSQPTTFQLLHSYSLALTFLTLKMRLKKMACGTVWSCK